MLSSSQDGVNADKSIINDSEISSFNFLEKSLLLSSAGSYAGWETE